MGRAKKQRVRKERAPRPERTKVRVGFTDMTFALVVLLLLAMGIVMMFSASYAIAINEDKEGWYYALRQVVFGVAGLIMMLIMSFVDYHIWMKKGLAVLTYMGAVVLLFLVLFIGTDLDTGCKRWIDLGVTTFQPSELAKFAIVILFAYLIDRNYDKMHRFGSGTLVYFLLLGVIVGLLMFEPHLSCSLLIVMIGVAQIFVGGAKWWHILVVGAIGAFLLFLFIMYLVNTKGVGYFTTRIETWLHPFDSEDTDGTWQTRQSLIAIGSGGIFGLGLGESRQKYLYLPESENDFVFAIVCEELGLLGALTVVLLFLLLVAQGFHIAANSKDRFGMLVAVGFTLQIALQAFINIAVVSGLVPNTGISLPFFSYGGTALIMQLVEMGIVLNISRSRQIIEPVRKSERSEEVPPIPDYPKDA